MVATTSFLSLLAAVASTQTSGCDLSHASLASELPPNQTQIVAPTTTPNFIALGVGVQNYTCASTDTYTNVGAVAELFDISCLVGTSEFGVIQNQAYDAWTEIPADFTTFDLISVFKGASIVLGQHYFIVNPVTGSGTSPKWDFTSARFNGNPEAFVVGARTGDLPSPNSTADVDWLSLKNVTGELATSIFRVETVGGVAPTACTAGSSPDLSLKYTAQYWFYGSSV